MSVLRTTAQVNLAINNAKRITTFNKAKSLDVNNSGDITMNTQNTNTQGVLNPAQNQVQNTTTKPASNSNRRTCSVWLNPAREFSNLINPNTGAPMTMGLVMNNTNPSNVLEGHGLGLDYMMDAAEKMTPKYQPAQSDIVGRMKQRAVKVTNDIADDYNRAIANAPAGAKKVKVYDCCQEMTQEDMNNIYLEVNGNKVPLSEILIGNLVKANKVTNSDGSEGVKYTSVKLYLKTAANLILETNVPRDTEAQTEEVVYDDEELFD